MTEKMATFLGGCVVGIIIAALAISIFDSGYRAATGKDIMQVLREAR